jgi:16S rRNA C967 or C1407 C5-methylase (RsmB/RsmF family)
MPYCSLFSFSSAKPKPRFLRVNTLKITTDSVIEELNKIHMVFHLSFMAIKQAY